MLKSTLKYILGVFKKKSYVTKKQKKIFSSNLNKELEEKIENLKKDNDQKDAYINKLIADIKILKN